jgi:hypothetical protein
MNNTIHRAGPMNVTHPARKAARAAATAARPLPDRIRGLDAALAVLSAGLASRPDTATPVAAAALEEVVAEFADAAAALAVEAATTAAGRGRGATLSLARAAAALEVRAARLRLRLVEYRARAGPSRRR